MGNRYYSAFSDQKITAPLPPKDQRRESTPPYPEKTRAWLKDIGPVGPKRNTTGTPEVKQSASQHMADDGGRVSKKISMLMHEGKDEKQAVAMAMNMDRAHRLTKEGGYIRKKKKY